VATSFATERFRLGHTAGCLSETSWYIDLNGAMKLVLCAEKAFPGEHKAMRVWGMPAAGSPSAHHAALVWPIQTTQHQFFLGGIFGAEKLRLFNFR